MYTEDFRRLMSRVGFTDLRYTDISDIDITDPEIKNLMGEVSFSSRTVRAFKLDDLEDACEDYGQMAAYMGDIPGHPDFFDLDRGHRFYRGEWKKVCGNTASMLSETRYRQSFAVTGNRKVHKGRFEQCEDEPCSGGSGCCCC